MEYGLQLYSVRDFTQKDLAYTLKKVAEIGYKYVEFAGFFGHSAEEVKAMTRILPPQSSIIMPSATPITSFPVPPGEPPQS